MSQNNKNTMPKQQQNKQPGIQSEMNPIPESIKSTYKGSGKLTNKVAIITGGDSGIGKAAALHFAREGADIVISYLNEDSDAELTKQEIENEGRKCLLIRGDIGQEQHCQDIVKQVMDTFNQIDILVNNAAEQHPQKSLLDITEEQLDKTFRTNIYSFFFLTKAALPHLKAGSSIINTASITAYAGSPELLDYSSTKEAIVSFTRSLDVGLTKQCINVNNVAQGPNWTLLIPSTFAAEQVRNFRSSQPSGYCPVQTSELGPAYGYLVSEDTSYVTGTMIHIHGGTVI